MEAQSYTAEERRAANQVWAAAGAYGFEPLFLARNTDGTIDFYMNCIVGLVHKYYGDALVRSLFDTWEGDLRQTMLDDLSWLYLESAAYALELPGRPVLSALRRAHADYFFGIQYKLSRQEWMAKNQLVYSMQAARWRAVQGRTPPVMTPYEKSLSAALSPETPPRPEELKAALLAVYAKFELFDGTVHQKAGLHLHLDGLLASLMTRTMPTQMIKTDRVTVEHSGAVDASGGGVHADKRLAHITLRQRAEEDRAYIESCFGRSLYPPERLRKAEQELCTGEHLGCHLWFASGVPSPEQAPPPRQSIWPSRPSFRPSGTGPITRKTLSFTAASCSGSPNRSATASSSTSSPTPGWPAAAVSTLGGSGAPSWTMAGCSAVQRRRIIPPLPLISCWTPRPPASTVRRSSRRRGLSLPRASRPAASRCG